MNPQPTLTIMNKIFRVIWNHTLAVWQCVSELTQARGKVHSARDARPTDLALNPSEGKWWPSAPSLLSFSLGMALFAWQMPGVAATTYDVPAVQPGEQVTFAPYITSYWRLTAGHSEVTRRYLLGDMDNTIHFSPTTSSGYTVKRTVNFDPGDVVNFSSGGLVWGEILHFYGNANQGATINLTNGTTLQARNLTYNGQSDPGYPATDLKNVNMLVDRGSTFEVTNPQNVNNTVHLDVWASEASGAGTLTVKGEVKVPHVLTLNGVSMGVKQKAALVINGGRVEALGLKLGINGVTKDTQNTVEIKNGGVLSVTTARGLMRDLKSLDSSNSPVRPLYNTQLKNTVVIDNGTISIGTATDTNYANNTTRHVVPSQVLFFGFDTQRSDQVKIDGGGLTVEVRGSAADTPIFQYSTAGLTGSGDITKTGQGTFVLTADNRRWTGNVNVQEGTLEIGGDNIESTDPGTYDPHNRQFIDYSAKSLYWTAVSTLPVGSTTNHLNEFASATEFHLAKDTTLRYSVSTGMDDSRYMNNKITGAGNVEIFAPAYMTVTNATHDYTGKTLVGSMTGLTLDGINAKITQTSEVQVGNLSTAERENGSRAILTVKNQATLRTTGSLILGNQFTGGVLVVTDKGHVTAAQLEQKSTHTSGRGLSLLTLKSGATLTLTESGEFMKGARAYGGDAGALDTLALEFDNMTPQTDRAVTLEIAGDDTVVRQVKGQEFQDTSMWSSSAARGALAGAVVKKTGAGTFVVATKNTRMNETWVVADGTLALGDIDNSQTRSDVVLSSGGWGEVSLLNNNRDLTEEKAALVTLGGAGSQKPTLAYYFKDNYSLTERIDGHGRVMQHGTGTMTIDTAKAFSGDVVVRDGRVRLLVTDTAAGDWAAEGGDYGAADSGAGEEKGVFELRSEKAAGDEHAYTFQHGMTGNGTFEKTGTGKIILSNANATKVYDFTGGLEVREGELLLDTGNTISQADHLYVGANQENGSNDATFTIKGSATVNGAVILAEGAKADTNNTLKIDGATLSAGQIITNREDTTRHIGFEMEHGATLNISEDGILFDLFDAETGSDHIELIGSGDEFLSVSPEKTATQFNKAIISGEGNLVKTGAGTLELTAANAYTGSLKVNEGMLLLGSNSADNDARAAWGGNGNITVERGAVVGVNLATDYTLSGTRKIVGAGDFVQQGDGTTEVTAQQEYTGKTYIRGGTLKVKDDTLLGQPTTDENKVIDTGSDTSVGLLAAGKGTLEIARATADGEFTWGRLLSGTGDLRKTGGAKVTLDHGGATIDDNDFVYGNTIVNEGELELATNNQIHNSGDLRVDATQANEVTFTLSGTATVDKAVVLGTRDSAAGSTNRLKMDHSILRAGQVKTDSRATDVNSALELANWALVELTNDGQLFENFNTAEHDKIEIGGKGTVLSVAEGKTQTQETTAAITDRGSEDVTHHHLVKAGAGTLVLTAHNTYSGDVAVMNGMLVLGNGEAKGNTQLGGHGNIALGGVTTAQTADNFATDRADVAEANQGTKGIFAVNFAVGETNNYTLGGDENADQDLTNNRLLTGTGDFVQLGANTTIVNLVHTYDGDTIIRGGTVRLVDGGELGNSTNAIDTGSDTTDGLIPAGKGVLEINTTAGREVTRLITGTGDLKKAGSGEAVLDHHGNTLDDNKSTYGNTVVNAGTLKLATNNKVVNSGDLVVDAKGDDATFAIEGTAQFDRAVILGTETSTADKLNRLTIEGAVLRAGQMKTARGTHTDVKVAVELKDLGLMELTDSETLFKGLNTTTGDKIELGGNGGGVISVTTGHTQTQETTAAISDRENETDLNAQHHLIKAGDGTLVLTAENTYSGQVAVLNGTLQLGAGAAVGTTKLGGHGDIILGGLPEGMTVAAFETARPEIATANAKGTFAVNFARGAEYFLGGAENNDSDTENDRLLTGYGDFLQVGENTTVVNKAHTYDGDTIIHGGVVKVVDGGRLGTSTAAVITGEEDKSGVLEINHMDAAAQTWTRGVTGTGGLTKSGTGLVTLDSSSNEAFNFTGELRVAEGRLEVAQGETLAATSIVVSTREEAASGVNGNAVLTLDKNTTLAAGTKIKLADENVKAGSHNALDMNGARLNIDVFTSARPETSTAKLHLIMREGAQIDITRQGTYEVLSAFSKAGDTVQVGKGGVTVNVADGVTAIQAKNAAVVDLDDGEASAHSVTKVGAGTLILNELNTYSGTLTVLEGKVQLGQDGTDARSARLGGKGTVALSQNTNLILNLKDGVAGVATEGVNAQGNYVMDRVIAGEGSLTQSGEGTSILKAKNTYQGTTTIEKGTLQVGDGATSTKETATLGGVGDIQNNGRLTYALTSEETLVRKVTDSGALEQKGTDGAVLEVTNDANDFTGNVFVTSGILTTKKLAALGHGTDLVLGQNVKGIANNTAGTSTPTAPATDTPADTPADISTETPAETPAVSDATQPAAADTPSSVDEGANRVATADDVAAAATPTVLRRARALFAAPMMLAVVEEPAPGPGTYQADFDEDTVWDRNLSGTGNFEKLGSGKLTFTSANTYEHSGRTIVNGGIVLLDDGVNFAQSELVLQQGELQADVGVHKVRGLTVSGGADTSRMTIWVNSGTSYTKYQASDFASINGGFLYSDLRQFRASFDSEFKGDLIPNVITVANEGTLSGTGFADYEDTSVLFDFQPVMDTDGTKYGLGKAVHLRVRADRPEENVCVNGNMGKVECIVRKYGDLHAVPLAKVADKEFDENPTGIVAQYFYSIDSEERVDNAVIRGLPLFTGSVTQTLQHDAQAAAAYAPRDPCDPTLTEHGYNLWAQLEQNWDQQGALRGSIGYEGRHSTLAIGKDVCVKDRDLRIGGLVAYTDSSLKHHGNQALHTAKMDLYQIGLYGDKQLSEKTDVDFQVGYGRGRVEGHRDLLLFTADSKYDVNLFYAGAGYNWRQGWYTPFVRFDYNYVRANSYKESGATVFGYNVEHQDRHSGILQLGSRFDWQPNNRWHVKGKVAVGYEVLDKYNTITAAFQGIPHAYFDTRSAENHRVMGLFETGVTYKANDKLDFSLNYRAIVKPDYHDQGGQVQMTVHF